MKSCTGLPQITLDQAQHFFGHNKDLEEGKWVKVAKWGDAAEACRLIVERMERGKKEKR